MALVLLGAAAAAAASPPYDFTRFEREVIPAWLSRFEIDFDSGIFAYNAKTEVPDLIGTVDVAHVLAAVGQLTANLSSAQVDAWKGTVDSHQTLPGGFYECHDPQHAGSECLGSDRPHWTAGEATATLGLLGRQPRLNNSNYVSLPPPTLAASTS